MSTVGNHLLTQTTLRNLYNDLQDGIICSSSCRLSQHRAARYFLLDFIAYCYAYYHLAHPRQREAIQRSIPVSLQTAVGRYIKTDRAGNYLDAFYFINRINRYLAAPFSLDFGYGEKGVIKLLRLLNYSLLTLGQEPVDSLYTIKIEDTEHGPALVLFRPDRDLNAAIQITTKAVIAGLRKSREESSKTISETHASVSMPKYLLVGYAWNENEMRGYRADRPLPSFGARDITLEISDKRVSYNVKMIIASYRGGLGTLFHRSGEHVVAVMNNDVIYSDMLLNQNTGIFEEFLMNGHSGALPLRHQISRLVRLRGFLVPVMYVLEKNERIAETP